MHPLSAEQRILTPADYLDGDPDEATRFVLDRCLRCSPLGTELLERHTSGPGRSGGPWHRSRAAVIERAELLWRHHPDRHAAYLAAEAVLSTPGSDVLLGIDDFELALTEFQARFGQPPVRRRARALARRASSHAMTTRLRHLGTLWKIWTWLVLIVTFVARAILLAVVAPGIATREALRVVGGRIGGWGVEITGGWRAALHDLRTPLHLPSIGAFRRFILLPNLVMSVLSIVMLVALRWWSRSTGSPLLQLRQRDIDTLTSGDLAPDLLQGTEVVAMNTSVAALAVWCAYSTAAAVIPSTPHLERALDDAQLAGRTLAWWSLQPLRWIRRVMRPIDWLLDKAFGSPFVGSGLLLFAGFILIAELLVNVALL